MCRFHALGAVATALPVLQRLGLAMPATASCDGVVAARDVGFAYAFTGGAAYRDALASGDYRLARNAHVPEPSPLGLMGAALALAGLARRRRSRAAG
jgi:hypothetical protein